MMEETLLLLRYNCPDSDCDYIGKGWGDLKLHVRATHGKLMWFVHQTFGPLTELASNPDCILYMFVTAIYVSGTKKYLHTNMPCMLQINCLSTFRLFRTDHRNRCQRNRLKAVSTPCANFAASAFSVKTSYLLICERSTRSALSAKETMSGINSEAFSFLFRIYADISFDPAFRITIVW
jgi:hypothetical protein